MIDYRQVVSSGIVCVLSHRVYVGGPSLLPSPRGIISTPPFFFFHHLLLFFQCTEPPKSWRRRWRLVGVERRCSKRWFMTAQAKFYCISLVRRFVACMLPTTTLVRCKMKLFHYRTYKGSLKTSTGKTETQRWHAGVNRNVTILYC